MLALGWSSTVKTAGRSYEDSECTRSLMQPTKPFPTKVNSFTSHLKKWWVVVDSCKITTTPLKLLVVHFFPIPRDTRDWADIEHESLELYIDFRASLGWLVCGICQGGFVEFVFTIHTVYHCYDKHLEVVGHSSLAKFQLKIDRLAVYIWLISGRLVSHKNVVSRWSGSWHQNCMKGSQSIFRYPRPEGVDPSHSQVWRTTSCTWNPVKQWKIFCVGAGFLPSRVIDPVWGLNMTNSCRRMSFWGRLFDHPERATGCGGKTHRKNVRGSIWNCTLQEESLMLEVNQRYVNLKMVWFLVIMRVGSRLNMLLVVFQVAIRQNVGTLFSRQNRHHC